MESTTISRRGRKSSVEAEKKKEMFLIWRSMPALVRMLPEAELQKMGYDIDDPMFKKLLGIKNQTQFCALFEVSNNQPARWEQDPAFRSKIEELSVNDHVMRFKKEVDFAFTQKVIREADSGRVKLWKQLFEGWREKIETFSTNRNFDMVQLVKHIEERNAAMRTKGRTVLSPSDEE